MAHGAGVSVRADGAERLNVYVGEWAAGREHGVGCELRGLAASGAAGGGGVQLYRGGWQQGERHGAAMGEVPPIAAWSEVWVGDGAALEAARAVVEEVTREPAETPSPWTCSLCGETVEGQFGACWSCGHPQPEG